MNAQWIKFLCPLCLWDGHCVGARIKNGLIIRDFIYIPSLVNKNKEIQRAVNLHFDGAGKKTKQTPLQINPLNKNGHIRRAILNCIYQNALDDISFYHLARDC